jgi:hypothetical protein
VPCKISLLKKFINSIRKSENDHEKHDLARTVMRSSLQKMRKKNIEEKETMKIKNDRNEYVRTNAGLDFNSSPEIQLCPKMKIE